MVGNKTDGKPGIGEILDLYFSDVVTLSFKIVVLQIPEFNQRFLNLLL